MDRRNHLREPVDCPTSIAGKAESPGSQGPRERGNQLLGLTRRIVGGGADSFSASPSANPVGRRKGTVQLTYGKRIALGTVAATTSAALIATSLLAGVALAAGSGGIGPGGVTNGSDAGGDPSQGVFPLRARHTYGDGLGAGRGHKGQDLMAACGKPIVAALPGRIQTRDYQGGGAGNYVVVDGKGSLEDTVYMHMEAPSALRKGERVEAGDLLGRVGNTGRSSACHLHFEMWSNPGWYEGGDALDPTPFLKALDPSA